MRTLMRPIMRVPRGGVFAYDLNGYVFKRPSLEELKGVVREYLADEGKSIDKSDEVVEDFVCRNNPHMAQHES